jgi:hypothetical protein
VNQKLAKCGGTALLLDRNTVPLEHLPDIAGDEAGTYVLLAGDWYANSAECVEALFQRANVINCSPPIGFQGYGNWLPSVQGGAIITRAFCPYYSLDERIFPFEKRPSINSRKVTAQELGYAPRPEFMLPRWVSEVAYYADDLAAHLLTLPVDDRRTALKPFHDMARAEVSPNSIIAQFDGMLPAERDTITLDSLVAATRKSYLRPLLQWALLRGDIERLDDPREGFSLPTFGPN